MSQMYGTVGERKTGLKSYCTRLPFLRTDVIKKSKLNIKIWVRSRSFLWTQSGRIHGFVHAIAAKSPDPSCRKVYNAIQGIVWSALLTLIRWIAIYQVDRVIQLSNNRGQDYNRFVKYVICNYFPYILSNFFKLKWIFYFFSFRPFTMQFSTMQFCKIWVWGVLGYHVAVTKSP